MKAIAWITAFVAIAGLASGPAWAQAIPVDEIARAHQTTKATLDPALPKRVDASMVLTGVQIEDVMLTYRFRVDRDKGDLSPEALDALGRRSLATACGNPVTRKILEAGGRYGFEYVDKFDATIMSVTVGKADCI